jgi:hypothetical protein
MAAFRATFMMRPDTSQSASDRYHWIAIVGLGIFFVWLAIIWLWPASVYTFTVDDTYYYLVTADNAAHGFGFTFDRMNPTNGFHPLWTFLLVPLSRLAAGNMEVFARLAMTVELALVFGGTAILARALRETSRWVLLALAILMINPYYAKIGVNGLESGLQWFFLCAALAVLLGLLRKEKLIDTSDMQFFALGLLLGACILSRLSTVFFAGGVLGMVLVLEWQRAHGSGQIVLLVRRLVVAGAGTLLVATPYFAWNYLSTGHWMSVSAAVKASRDFSRSNFDWILCGGLILVALVGSAMLWKSRHYSTRSRDLMWAGFPLLVYAILQSLADLLLRGVRVSELWYYVPQAILVVLALAFILDRAAAGSRVGKAVIAITAVVLIVFAGITWNYRLDPTSYSGYVAERKTADWLRENLPAEAAAAGWDVGIVGGFAERPVANLDGLINSWDYKTNYFDKGLTDQWLATREPPIDYIAQYFWNDQMNPETLRNYRGVDLTKWKVAYHERVAARSWSHLGQSRDSYYLVLSRGGTGTPLLEFLEQNVAK